MDNFWGCFLVSYPKNSILHSANITAINSDDVLVVTEGEDTIYHSEMLLSMFVFTDENLSTVMMGRGRGRERVCLKGKGKGKEKGKGKGWKLAGKQSQYG